MARAIAEIAVAQFHSVLAVDVQELPAEIRQRAADLGLNAQPRSPSMSLKTADMPPGDTTAERTHANR